MSVYEQLETEDRKPKRLVDHSEKLALLPTLAATNGVVEQRILGFCADKRISREALEALGTRVRIDGNGGVELAWGYPALFEGRRVVSALKYRNLDPTKERHAEVPSTFLRPLIIGDRDSLDWFLAEGETDTCRLYDLVGDFAAILCLPAGATTFKRGWAHLIPGGATVHLAHDADDAGDMGAAKAAAMLARTVRVRPPVGDWCEWEGNREQFIAIVAAARAGGATKKLATVRADHVQMRSIEWLDRPHLQQSAFHLVAGPKGVGKGTWLARTVTRFTTGGFGSPRNVLIISSEDSMEVDSTPRLAAAGADLSRVTFITERIILPRDVNRIRDLALEIGDMGAIVIDPIGNHLGGVDTDKEGLVRHAIGDLNQLADELVCAILGVRHISKSRQNGALASVLGSVAWVDVPRAVLMFARDDEDETVFHVQVLAGNRSGRGAGRAYRIELRDLVGLDEPVTYAAEIGASSKDVEELLAGQRQASRSQSARELILDILEENDDAHESDALDARVARETGLAVKTVKNARTKLKDEGLIKVLPEKDEVGTILRWKVSRTQAARR